MKQTPGIVIYEDNPFFRNSISELIRSGHLFEVKGAFENCDKVAFQMERLRPDVVLMDIEMPGTNGIEGLKLIKAGFPGVQVIMLTVFEDNDSVFDAICAGASGYLLKNTSPAMLLSAIEDVVNGGSPITSSIARKILTFFPRSASRTDNMQKLTPREQEVLQLLVTGHSYKMIAAACEITIETVRTHIKRIYEKLQVHSATEAAAKAFQQKK